MYRHRDLLYDLSGFRADPNGLPYSFQPEVVPGKPDGFLVWLPMDQSEQVHKKRLEYLRDADFLGRRARVLTMEFAAVDVARSALAHVRLQFVWGDGGGIKGSVQITGMPITAVANSIWVRRCLLCGDCAGLRGRRSFVGLCTV